MKITLLSFYQPLSALPFAGKTHLRVTKHTHISSTYIQKNTPDKLSSLTGTPTSSVVVQITQGLKLSGSANTHMRGCSHTDVLDKQTQSLKPMTITLINTHTDTHHLNS